MKKTLLVSILAIASVIGANAQSINDPFFEKVSYVGAFGNEDWTKGWANFDPQNTDYPETTTTLGNGELSYAAGYKITSNTSISGVVKLSGWVYVKDGATLTIEKGTIIRGESSAALIVERGGKLIAEGTVDKPIVFTSIKPKGSRAASDWAGVIICGKATNNKSNNTLIEGGVGAYFGAGDQAVENDNSGILKYVRIEFPGYDIDGAGNEINGLTMGSVGSGTTIDYVQVSFSGDDAFEWFGGSVNCKHLIALATEDDDFDTDNGYVGKVQFALAVRDPKVCDTDGARGFESDNDANSSYNKPYTAAVFSNVSLFGPKTDESANQKHDVAMLLRRNTRLQIYNLFSTGFVKGGVVIDGDVTQKAAGEDSLVIKNSIFAGYSKFISTKGTNNPLSNAKAWLVNGKNDTLNNLDNVKVQFPIVVTAPVFIPESGSVLLTKGSSFGAAVTSIVISAAGNVTSIKTTETLQLSATVTPDNAVSKEVSWSIESGSDVASVSESGLVTPLKAGNVTIKAVAKDGSGISSTFALEVKSNVAVGSTSVATASIWPNPAMDLVQVKCENEISSLEVLNNVGQIVLKVANINSNNSSANISNLNSGIYFMKLTMSNGAVSVNKIVKK
ncbi:MAG TPA: Ig-like domain-containing protein [Bacteroidales bacterium]|nr:Ig-like domain-containing protein [Bacteroidales bacterium]